MRTLIACCVIVAVSVTPVDAYRNRGALQVVDASNAVVGQFTGGGCFVRQVGQYWVDICGVQVDGTTVNEGLPTRYYIEPGCQGTAFAESFSGALLSRGAYAAHGTLEFVGDPVAPITVVSWQYQADSSANRWVCINNEEDLGDGFYYPVFDLRAGPLHSLPLFILGTPPFQLRTSP